MSEISEKQLNANKENAKLGGVKTVEGKAVSRFNAVKHGILKETVSEYEKVDYKAFYASLSEDFPPKNILEEIILERIAIGYIKLVRASKAEAEFMKTVINPTIGFDLPPLYTKMGYQPVMKSEQVELLASMYSRYETSAENRFYKSLEKLIELRALKI